MNYLFCSRRADRSEIAQAGGQSGAEILENKLLDNVVECRSLSLPQTFFPYLAPQILLSPGMNFIFAFC